MANNSPSIKDVAEYAGVSIATVSRVIHNKPGFSQVTLKKVQDAMDALGYRPNKLAQALRSNSMRIVALSLPFIWHPFFSEFAFYVESRLDANGYGMLLSNNQSDPQSELNFLKMAQENKVDGLIGITYNDIEPYLSSKIPFVSIDRYFNTQEYQHVATITSDNFHGGKIAFDELRDRGAQKIAYVGEVAPFPNNTMKRKQGFIGEAKKQKVDVQIYECPENSLESQYLLDQVVTNIEEIDGIFCVNDEVAYRLISKLKKTTVKIPADVQIVGFYGFNILNELPSPISSVQQSAKVMAFAAVDSLLSLIKGDQVDDQVIPVSFRQGETTRFIGQSNLY